MGLAFFQMNLKFTARPKKKHLHLWRDRGLNFASKLVPTFKSGLQIVHAWGEFSLGGRISLIGIIDSFISNSYQLISVKHILPFMYNVHDEKKEFLLQADNCGPHRA